MVSEALTTLFVFVCKGWELSTHSTKTSRDFYVIFITNSLENGTELL